jgi:hypothetical protein
LLKAAFANASKCRIFRQDRPGHKLIAVGTNGHKKCGLSRELKLVSPNHLVPRRIKMARDAMVSLMRLQARKVTMGGILARGLLVASQLVRVHNLKGSVDNSILLLAARHADAYH